MLKLAGVYTGSIRDRSFHCHSRLPSLLWGFYACVSIYIAKTIFCDFFGVQWCAELDRNTKYRIRDMNVTNVTLRHARHNHPEKNWKLPPIAVIHEKEQFLKYPDSSHSGWLESTSTDFEVVAESLERLGLTRLKSTSPSRLHRAESEVAATLVKMNVILAISLKAKNCQMFSLELEGL
jgi:hypothetical protein